MAISRAKKSTILNANQRFNSFKDTSVINYRRSNLALNLDAGDSSSYPGSGTTWFDTSGNGNNGTLFNGVTFGTGNGGYFSFPGNGYVNCGNGSSLNISSAITINVIFRASSWPIGSWSTLVSKGDTSYRVQNSNDIPSFNFGTTGLSIIDYRSVYAIAKNNWYMATSVFDGSTKKIYLNSILDKSDNVTGTISTNSFNVYIGENAQATGRYFTGDIAAVQIYNVALNQSEINELYDFYKGRYQA